MKKIRTAIIGLGKISHGYDDILSIKKMIQYPTHFSAIKKDKRFMLVAAADTNSNQRRAFQKKVPRSVKVYTDYRTMLKSEAVDLLVVAVPTELHYAVCSYALQSGIKHILCEKPITRTLAEAQKLIAQSRRYKAKVLVNYQRSYSNSYERLAQLIRKGTWGNIVSVSVQYNNGIFNTATHLIHLLEKIFGPIRMVQSIKSDTRDSAADPNISFVAFTKNARIFFEGVPNVDFRLLEIDVKFQKGRLMLSNDSLSEFRPAPRQGLSFLQSRKPIHNIDMKRSMADVYENVFQVLARRKQPKCDIHTATQALKVAARAVESAKSGKALIV